MKRRTNLLLLPTLTAALGSTPAGRVPAQTFNTLHNFTAFRTNSSGVYTNSDGVSPFVGLILSDNTLYGTTPSGGSSGNGTIFKVNTDGTRFETLYSFTATPPYPGPYTNTDGAGPSDLVLSSNTLFGTASGGGTAGSGTLFKINTDGSGFTIVYTFTAYEQAYQTNSDGFSPVGLVLSGDTLYGTANRGGRYTVGTVFKLNTNGTGFTTLHSFGNEGARPQAGVIISDNTLYGTTTGAANATGTVFKLQTDGSGFTILYQFPDGYGSGGRLPEAPLVLSGNMLYGTTSMGSMGTSRNAGTVFAISTDGTGFTNLHNFGLVPDDGIFPQAGLILSGDRLYGSTTEGGGNGTIFALNTDGTGFTTLHNFTSFSGDAYYGTNSDGGWPYAGLILSGNTLYGTASRGGSSGNGTVFSIFIQPRLTIISSETNTILTWPTNYDGFTLQSATNLPSPFWTTNLSVPVVVNGQNTVTNPISGSQQFYRLTH